MTAIIRSAAGWNGGRSTRTKLLPAIDGSKSSQAAAEAVAAQFPPQGNEVRALHVIEPVMMLPYFDGGEFYSRQLGALEKEQFRRGKELTGQVEKSFGEGGFQASSSVEEGDPRAVIVDHGEQWKADLIVVGSHGRKGLDRLLLGSVSEYVARHARCSVEIVRPPLHLPPQPMRGGRCRPGKGGAAATSGAATRCATGEAPPGPTKRVG